MFNQHITEENYLKEYRKAITLLFATASKMLKREFHPKDSLLSLHDYLVAVPFVTWVTQVDQDRAWELFHKTRNAFSVINGYIIPQEYEDSVKLKVHIPFVAPRNVEDAEVFINEASSLTVSTTTAFLFVYLHEIFHILFNHGNLTYVDMLKKRISEHPNWKGYAENLSAEEQQSIKQEMLNVCFDLFVNGVIISKAKQTSSFNKLAQLSSQDRLVLYSKKAVGKTVEEILDKMLDELTFNNFSVNVQSNSSSSQNQQGQNGQNQQSQNSQNGQNGQNQQSQNSQNGQNDQNQQSQNGQNQQGQNDSDLEIVDVTFKYGDENFNYRYIRHKNAVLKGGNKLLNSEAANAVKEAAAFVKRDLISRFKGAGSLEFMKELGVPIEVPIDWLVTLEGPLLEFVRYKTRRVTINWRRLKRKYRHICKLPEVQYMDNKLVAVVSIDQSGSMSDTELRKINFILSKLVKRVNKLFLIIHDYEIVYEKEYKKKIESSIKELLQKRFSNGGTSHAPVFNYISDIIRSHKLNVKDMIYICFSDMYSDIDGIYEQYPWLLAAQCYWVTTDCDSYPSFCLGKINHYLIDMISGNHITKVK